MTMMDIIIDIDSHFILHCSTEAEGNRKYLSIFKYLRAQVP